MADQSLGQPMLNLNNASSLPRLDDGDNYTDWLRQLDITVHDIPYIDSILQQGYAEWRKLVSDMPELGEAGFFLADSRGDLLLADSPASGKPLDPSWPPPMEAAIAQSLREHEACAIETADGVYVAVPLLTRSRGEVFAALGCFLRESGARQRSCLPKRRLSCFEHASINALKACSSPICCASSSRPNVRNNAAPSCFKWCRSSMTRSMWIRC